LQAWNEGPVAIDAWERVYAHNIEWRNSVTNADTMLLTEPTIHDPCTGGRDVTRLLSRGSDCEVQVVGHRVTTLVAAATVAEGVIISEAGVAILWRIHQVVLCTSESL
jgi:hypothetical protein